MGNEGLSPAGATAYVARRWHLKIHPETVRRWVRRGRLPATRTTAGRILIEPAAIEAVFATPAATTGSD